KELSYALDALGAVPAVPLRTIERRPITFDTDRAVRLAPQPMRSGQLEDVAEEGQRCRDVRESQKLVEGGEVEVTRDIRVPEQRLDLGREQKAAVRGRVIERLLAKAIARREERPARLVPERKREHAVEAGDTVGAELLIEMNDRLGVRARSESMPLRGQRGAVILMVVDLAVERHPDGAVLVRHRLPPGLTEIDDTEAAVREDDARVGALIQAEVVGAAVHHHVP